MILISNTFSQGSIYLNKRIKAEYELKIKVADFVSMFPEKEPYFSHIFKPDNRTQKKLEDEMLFNQISEKIIEDALKLYENNELEKVKNYQDAVKFCKLATETSVEASTKD